MLFAAHAIDFTLVVVAGNILRKNLKGMLLFSTNLKKNMVKRLDNCPELLFRVFSRPLLVINFDTSTHVDTPFGIREPRQFGEQRPPMTP